MSLRSLHVLRSRFAYGTFLVIAVVTLPLLGNKSLSARLAPRTSSPAATGHIGIVQDWSTHHLIYTQGDKVRAFLATQRDPRAFFSWMRTVRAAQNTRNFAALRQNTATRNSASTVPRDWSVSLGGGNEAAAMFPAKFTFNSNTTPDCTNDYVVYTLNVVGSSGQANLVGINNLYSGSSPAGICGATPTVLFAYNISANRNPTSPTTSLDGKKVAFVENHSNPPIFHVLKWTAGQGTVTSPVKPTALQMTSLNLTGANSDTVSSPFIDYSSDTAYVGSDNGRLYKITGVFNGTPALAGSPFPIIVSNGKRLTGPIFDGTFGNVYVGSADGMLYAFSSDGLSPVLNSPLPVGNGAARGGIVDPPIVDSFNQWVYAFSGDDGSNAVEVQVNSQDFSVFTVAPIGNNAVVNIHSGDFNNDYFDEPNNQIGTADEWFLYVCGVATDGTNFPVLYRTGFDTSRNMNSTVDATSFTLTSHASEQCSPLTDFKNTNDSVDQLFFGLTTSSLVEVFDISSSTAPTLGASAPSSQGTSGIIVDNDSPQAQASSIYFTTLGNGGTCGGHRCAIKLTQSGLQ
jgi:hypothetical protein